MSHVVSDALRLYTEQFRESDNLLHLTSALLNNIPQLEQDYQDLLNNRWVDTAIGEQLDRMGDIVGVLRQGRSDNAYRSAIRFQIFINTSKTEPETIITATRVLSGGDFIRYWENYAAGFQVFTDGPNTLDVSGSVIDEFGLLLSGNGYLSFDDGASFLMRTSFEPPESLAAFLANIKPAGVDSVAVSFSLGETPLFGYGSDFNTFNLTLDDGGEFELYDGNFLGGVLDFGAVSPDGFEGYAEMVLQKLTTDNMGDLAISSNIVDPINTGVKLEGIRDDTLSRFILAEPGIDLDDLDVQEALNVFTAIETIEQTFDEEPFGLRVYGDDLFVLDDDDNFILADGEDYAIVVDEFIDDARLTFDNGDPALVFVATNEKDEMLLEGGDNFVLDDNEDFLLSIDEPGFSEGALITDDGGDFASLITETTADTFVLDDTEELQIARQALVEDVTKLATDNGYGILLDDDSLLGVGIEAKLAVPAYLELENDAEFGLITYGAAPGEGILEVDNEAEFELNIFSVLDEQSPLLIFDQNQTPKEGGKYVEGLVA